MLKKFNSTEFNLLLKELYALQRLGIKAGLEHTEKLLEICGNPQNDFKSIHIAGTNGKGSTAAMLFSILREAGYKVGLYTSPHLIRFNERIRVNGIPITDTKIVEFMSQNKTAIDQVQATFFEATTAMAYCHFRDCNVDVAVIETGLGGRLDSTNVLNPDVTIITSITSDHTEILGKDLQSIAYEKGGIIKNKVPLVLSLQSDEVKKVIYKIADENKADITYCNSKDLLNITLDEKGTIFRWRDQKYSTSLIGEHQARNAVLAIEAATIFNKIDDDVINKGLSKVVWPARLQKLHQTLPIFYDVAHNPHGIQVLLKTLLTIYPEKPIGLMALKADKELLQIVPHLKNRFQKLLITTQPETGLMDAQNLHLALSNYGIKSIVVSDITIATKLINNAVTRSVPGIIFGSHYIGASIYKEYGFSFDNGVI